MESALLPYLRGDEERDVNNHFGSFLDGIRFRPSYLLKLEAQDT